MEIVHLCIIAALVLLLKATLRPYLCTALYVGGLLALGGFKPELWLEFLTRGGLALVYFWLLHRFESRPLWFWIIAIGGLSQGLV